MPNTTRIETGNYLELVTEGTWEAGYRTPEAFIRAMGVDPKEWIVKSGRSNSWPTSGWNSNEEQPWVVINHQQKFEMLRREPVSLHPHIQPVKIHSRKRRGTNPGRVHHGLQTSVELFDIHAGFERDGHSGKLRPFHDRRVLDIALQVITAVKPSRITIGGDGLDLAEQSRFVSTPDYYQLTQPAIVELAWWLAQIRMAAPAAHIDFLQGNHDMRLETQILTNLNWAYGLKPVDEMHLPPALSVPRLLALHNLDINYVGDYPSGAVWYNDTCKVIHGDVARGGSGATVAAEVKDQTVTVIHGHIHRHERATRTVHERNGPRMIQAVCPGCACHIDGRVPGKSKEQNWQQGFSVTRFDAHQAIVTVAEVHDGRCIFEGVLYTAEDRTAQLSEDTGWDFSE